MRAFCFDQVVWPALRFGYPNYALTLIASSYQLTLQTRKIFKAHCLLEFLILVDSEGRRFDLANPTMQRPATLSSAIVDRFRPRMHPVNWECMSSSSLKLEELKCLISTDMELYPELWGDEESNPELFMAKDIVSVFKMFVVLKGS
ncbi:MAG: hypothetical protein NXI04_21370 [Planctomycetaceae bacterium]|nr:hypothetical protein [Planctomycetaceae bacterium]